MRRPMEAILVAPDENMRHAIVTGEKQITIRSGFRNYTLGPTMLCCHLVPWAVMVDVVSVDHKMISQLDHQEVLDDGFKTRIELLDGLRQFYPGLDVESPVTIIRWGNVRGALVDESP